MLIDLYTERRIESLLDGGNNLWIMHTILSSTLNSKLRELVFQKLDLFPVKDMVKILIHHMGSCLDWEEQHIFDYFVRRWDEIKPHWPEVNANTEYGVMYGGVMRRILEHIENNLNI